MEDYTIYGVAVTTIGTDSRIVSKAVIRTLFKRDAIELADRMNWTPSLRVDVVRMEHDTFGKCVWLRAE